MSLTATHKQTNFGVGDKVKVVQTIKEGEKSRSQVFEGTVIKIKGDNENKSFTVRRIGAAQVGIERIFPLASPSLEKIEVTREGVRGVRHSKLYYIREKSKREIEKIYSRHALRTQNISASKKTVKKEASKKTAKKTSSKK